MIITLRTVILDNHDNHDNPPITISGDTQSIDKVLIGTTDTAKET
jgi:hypothetical protein